MARIDPAIEEVLRTLDETPLRGLSVQVRDAIDELAEPDPDNVDLRILNSRAQLDHLDAMRRAVGLELEALQTLPFLAQQLGLPARIDLVTAEGQRFELGGKRREKALKTFLSIIGETIDLARHDMFEREGTILR